MIDMKESFRKAAKFNAVSSLSGSQMLPDNVFVKTWDKYFFFESDRIFEESFIDFKNLILEDELTHEICLVNLGCGPIGSSPQLRDIFLDEKTNFSEYQSMLDKEKSGLDGSTFAWLMMLGRYVCASDRGDWVIYCEKEEDIAVLAVQDTLITSRRLLARMVLKADSIASIFESKVNLLYDYTQLVLAWKLRLANSYGRKGRGGG